MNIQTRPTNLNLRAFCIEIGLPEQISNSVVQADIVLLPVGRKGAPYAFARGASDLFIFFREHNVSVEIACADDNFEEIELNSRVLRLGKIVLKDVILPVALSILSSYIYDVTKDDEVKQPIVEFVSPTQVSVEIVIVDSMAVRKSLSIEYNGDAKNFAEVAKEIENLWNEH